MSSDAAIDAVLNGTMLDKFNHDDDGMREVMRRGATESDLKRWIKILDIAVLTRQSVPEDAAREIALKAFDCWIDAFCNKYDRMPKPREIWNSAIAAAPLPQKEQP
jgi:hypothetical protein